MQASETNGDTVAFREVPWIEHRHGKLNLTQLRRRLSTFFLCLIPSFAVFAQPNPPVPPLRRISTTMLGERVDSFIVKGETAWFGRESDVIAWDLKRGLELWKRPLDRGQAPKNIAVDGAAVFVSTDPKDDKGDSTLIALEANT